MNCLVLMLAAAVGGPLVIDQRLPDVNYQVIKQNVTPPAATKNCRAGCPCTQKNCQCGNVAAACSGDAFSLKSIAEALQPLAVSLAQNAKPPVQCEPVASATIDESMLRTVAAQAQGETDTITVLAPVWCKGPCAWLEKQIGGGDSITKVVFVRKEAWWPLAANESYPLLINMQTLKKWSQDPRPGAKDIRPRNMDEARAKLGIVPKAKGHVVGLTVGTLPREQVDLLRAVLGQSGRRDQGPKPLTQEYAGGKIVVPADSVAEWDTKDGVQIMNFTKRPRVIFGGILNQDLDRIVITADTLTLELPWAPDATWRIE